MQKPRNGKLGGSVDANAKIASFAPAIVAAGLPFAVVDGTGAVLGEVSPGAVIDEVERAHVRLDSIELSQEGERRRLELDIALPPGTQVQALVARIADVPGVTGVRWE